MNYIFPKIKLAKNYTLVDALDKIKQETIEVQQAYSSNCHIYEIVLEILDVIHAAETALRYVESEYSQIDLDALLKSVIQKNAKRGYYCIPQAAPKPVERTVKQIAEELADMIEKKQAAYGDSFGKSEGIIKILYPNGIKPEDYKHALALIRIIDKLFRIATNKGAFGENPFIDIAGYGLLGAL